MKSFGYIKAAEMDRAAEEESCESLYQEEQEPDWPTPEPEIEEVPPVKEKKRTTMKLIVWFCLLNGIAWVWCSYILAALGKEQIAESLSQVALTEIIGVVLVYAVKSIFENLSKNNAWPDKPSTDSDPPDGVG